MYALEIKNISKIYSLYKNPIDRLKEIIFRRRYHDEFHSLSDISFDIPYGETVGIIGDNGAGKSTLLKILAGTLTPTNGKIICKGRVAALLELGAGFHPDFTGRENIHLNALLLGLTENEIKERMQEMIDFSELNDFIDKPVKTYSSGMYVRLAFSIATSVDPDILIIDEALSVGDAHFQKKCIDRMMNFRDSGKTLLFCSHSMYMVQELCNTAIWIKNGCIQTQGDVNHTVNSYMDYIHEKDAQNIETTPTTTKSKQEVWLKKAYLVDSNDKVCDSINTGDDLYLHIKISTIDNKPRSACIGIAINRQDQIAAFGTSTLRDKIKKFNFSNNMEVIVNFPKIQLLNGKYFFIIALMDENGLHVYHLDQSVKLSINNQGNEAGLVNLAREWHI
jgi:ABC-type polysaccharide/polyol phosphate transport system ATPase subunit